MRARRTKSDKLLENLVPSSLPGYMPDFSGLGIFPSGNVWRRCSRTMRSLNGLEMKVAFSGMSPPSGAIRPLAIKISIQG